MEKRSIGVGVVFNYIFSLFHRFTNLSLYTFIIFLNFFFYLSLYFIRFSIQADNIIIIFYLICICFLFLFLILCLSTNKIIKQDNLVSVYVRGNFNLKKQILFIKFFLHQNQKKIHYIVCFRG
jgi:hypothetical protein